MTVAKGYTNFNWQLRMLKQQTDCCGNLSAVTACYCMIFNFTFDADTELTSIEVYDQDGNLITIPFAPPLNFWDEFFTKDVELAIEAALGITDLEVTLIHVLPTRWALCINYIPPQYTIGAANYTYGGLPTKQNAVQRNDCGSVPRVGPLILTFYSEFAEPFTSMVDPNDVTEWNTWIGNVFTRVEVFPPDPGTGEVVVRLHGGVYRGVIMYASVFSSFANIKRVEDQYELISVIESNSFANSGIEQFTANYLPVISSGAFSLSVLNYIDTINATDIQDSAFDGCASLIAYNIPLAESIGTFAFQGTAITSINFPNAQTVGDGAFFFSVPYNAITEVNLPLCTALGSTSGDDNVFNGINGATINPARFNVVLSTNNAGNPDGDIQYLSANNTATITYV